MPRHRPFPGPVVPGPDFNELPTQYRRSKVSPILQGEWDAAWRSQHGLDQQEKELRDLRSELYALRQWRLCLVGEHADGVPLSDPPE